MAKGDTKTNQYLDIAANGTRADLPTDTCCETRTQTLIRGVAERIMDVEDEVEEIKNNPDVVDIVPTYAALQNYDTSSLTDKDIIRVLQDETHDGESTYYRYNKQSGTWTYVGTVGDYYTKTAADAKFQDKLTAGSNITISDQNVISATDTTYSNFTGTDGTAAGADGLVPAPATTDAGKFLSASGLWEAVAGGGGVTELTTADYNWPVANPDGIAYWLLDDGIYHTQYGVKEYIDATNFQTIGVSLIVITSDSGSKTAIEELHSDGTTTLRLNLTSTGESVPSFPVTLLSNKFVKQSTGSSTTSVMSQNAVTSMVYADPATRYKVRITNDQSSIANNAVAIGRSAANVWENSVGIGYLASASSKESVALGHNAMISNALGGIALGAYSGANSQGEMNIGSTNTSYGYNSSNYRLLTGLYDPQSAHDAATKGYCDNAIINGGTTAPTTATVGAVGTQYTYVDTTGTHTAHLCVCTEIDTTDPSTPVYTWQTLI